MIQIVSLSLYNNDGLFRTIDFRQGELNIITGGSTTGKSATIEIIDYCFGSKKCQIPKGIIRDSVKWYLLKLKSEKHEIIIGRKDPGADYESSSSAYIEFGEKVLIPESSISENTTIENVKDTIAELIEIPPNLHQPPEGKTRKPLSATIRHALKFCIQDQNEVANKYHLFHGQSDRDVKQSIKDTLPLFLGTINPDKLAIKDEIRRLRAEKRMIQTQLNEEQSIRGSGITKAVSLIEEARNVGLIDSVDYENNLESYQKELINITNWSPSKPSYPSEDRLTILQSELLDKEEELIEKNRELRSVENYLEDFRGYSNEVELQKNRLKTINLFQELEVESSKCPFCNNNIDEKVDGISALKENLKNLNEQLDKAERNKPRLQEHLEALRSDKAKVIESILTIRNSINALISENERASKIEDLNSRRSHVIGRISLWLESVAFSNKIAEFEAEIRRLDSNINVLEEQIEDESEEIKLESALFDISSKISQFAKSLKLEFSEYPARLNLTKLTVLVDKINNIITLDEMGSGENWLGYSLATHLALHKVFIERNSPVPRFIIFDQLSQIYYPQDYDGNIDDPNQSLKTEDQIKLQVLLKHIYDFVEALDGKLQIILLEHADLDIKWFQDSVIERWRNGNALIK